MARIWDEEKGDEKMAQVFNLVILKSYYLNRCNSIEHDHLM